MKYLFIILLLVSCAVEKETPTSIKATGNSQKCNSGECWSYLESYCCPKSAPYACGGYCYTYSGGGSCTNYKTQCY